MFKAHKLLDHSTLGSRALTKTKEDLGFERGYLWQKAPRAPPFPGAARPVVHPAAVLVIRVSGRRVPRCRAISNSKQLGLLHGIPGHMEFIQGP